MSEIQIFKNPEFGEIRTIKINGEPWFVGRDVAKALGYAKPEGAVSAHCRHPLKQGIPHPQSPGKEIEVLVIPEGDMYRLISKSKLKSAEQFEEWVFDEVLPTIRKTGEYRKNGAGDVQDKIKLLAQGTTELYEKVDELDKKLDTALMELPLLGVESDKIDSALKRRGVEVVGGKESNAYRDKRLLKRVYWDIHGQLRREFGVSTYKGIKRKQTDPALDFISKYQLPLALREEVESVNAQQTLDLEGGAKQC